MGRIQAGQISLAQALAMGLTIDQVKTRLRSGKWERLAPRVYRIAGVPSSRDQDEWCAFLWAEGKGALALGSAARRWSFRGFDYDPVSIAVLSDIHHKKLPFQVLGFGPDCLMHVTRLGVFQVASMPRNGHGSPREERPEGQVDV